MVEHTTMFAPPKTTHRLPAKFSFVLVLAMCFAGFPASADPASTLQTLMIVDQGNFLSFQWSFYYIDFPPRFVLREQPSKTISLENPSTIYENISEIIPVAFDLTIDGQPVHPDKVSRLTISPNKLCTVTMIYRGRPGGHLELRAPVLQYLPPTSMINYEILGLGSPSGENVVTGNLIGHAGPFPQSIAYQQVSGGTLSAPETESDFFVLFKSQLRTAWINSNWLLLIAILLLVQKPGKVIVLMGIITAGWIATCFLYALADIKFPWAIREIVLGLATALIGVIAARRPQKWLWLALLSCGAGLLNSGYDLQQIRWTAEDRAPSSLVGLCLGFVGGMAAVILVVALLLAECKKYREFESQWAPKLCWVLAALALVLPLQRLIFR